jgi:protein SCO1/2
MRRLLAAVLTLAGLIALPGQGSAAPEGSRYDARYFTNSPVVTQDGKTVRFYDDLIKGKRVVINFAYLNCRDICPLAISRLAEVKRLLGDAVGRDVFFYTITMDPEHDTPEQLKMYAEAFDAGPGWTFLTGNPADIEQIRYNLGERARKLSEHRNDIVLGNDIDGDWSRSSTFAEIVDIVATIRELDPVYRDQVHATRADYEKAQNLRLANVPGQAMFLQLCSTCHTIGQGKLVGPDLKGLTERRERDWLERYLRAPGKMRAEGDPIAAALREQFKAVRMPDLQLGENDVADLLSYIDRKSNPDSAKSQSASAAQKAEAPQATGDAGALKQ